MDIQIYCYRKSVVNTKQEHCLMSVVMLASCTVNVSARVVFRQYINCHLSQSPVYMYVQGYNLSAIIHLSLVLGDI